MNKINGSDRMKVSTEIPATTHTRNRYRQPCEIDSATIDERFIRR